MRTSMAVTDNHTAHARQAGFTPSLRSPQAGFTPFLRSPQAGFTLVELMVALALMALAATAVILTIRPGNGDARAQATLFAARAAAVRDRAVIEQRSYGLWVSPTGFGFERRVDGAWQRIDDERGSRRDWQSGTAISVDGTNQGRVRFNRVGLPDHAMIVEMTQGGDNAIVRIDAAGDVAVQ